MNGAARTIFGILPWSSSVDRERESKGEFEKVAVPHLSHLYTSALYLTKNEAEAEDLVQETYLRAFRFFEKFEQGTNIKAWLLSVQNNLFINRYRQKKRQPETVEWEKINEAYESMVQSDEGEKANPESILGSQRMDDEIEKALRELPEEFRSAIVLVDIEELTYEEAAKVMECPVGTVRSRVSRGRRMLQVALRDYAQQRGLIRLSGKAS